MERKRVGHVELPGSHTTKTAVDHHWGWRLALAFVALIGIVHAASYVYATSDDAFISLRYARNLSDGHGLVYNPGEQPVEGFSNPLFTIVAAALLWAGAAPLWVAKGIGVASLGASLLLLPRLVRWLRTGSAALPAIGAAVLLAASPFAALGAVSGLETSLHALLVLLATLAALIETHRGRVCFTPVAWLLVAASRPEGALLAAGVAACQWIALGFEKRVFAVWLLGFAVPGTALVGARYAYYDALLPNTFGAKVGFGSAALGKGFGYLGRFLAGGGVWVAIPAAIGLAFSLRARPVLAALTLAPIAAQTLFIVLVGGEFMPGFRFVMPVYPLLCAMAAIGLVEIGRRLPRALARTGPWVLLGLVCAALLWRQDAALRESKMRFWLMHSPPWTAYLGQTDLRGTFLAGHQAAGEYVRRRAQPGDRLAVTEAGVVPFYAETATLDLLGLNDRQIAELWRSARSVDSPEGGRDVRRAYRQLVFAEPPRWFVLDGHFNRPSGGFTPRLRTARWIVQSPEWRRYRPVFRSRVYDAKTAGMQNDRINVVFERDDAPP